MNDKDLKRMSLDLSDTLSVEQMLYLGRELKSKAEKIRSEDRKRKLLEDIRKDVQEINWKELLRSNDFWKEYSDTLVEMVRIRLNVTYEQPSIIERLDFDIDIQVRLKEDTKKPIEDYAYCIECGEAKDPTYAGCYECDDCCKC